MDEKTDDSRAPDENDTVHFCPVCLEPMTRATRQGVAIEICSAHGLWLDDGKLERILAGEVARFEELWSAAAKEEARQARRGGSLIDLLSLLG